MNLCRSCGQDFGSVSAFDAHRVGKHEYLWDEEHPDGRRCLSVFEMARSKRGFVRNERGSWSLARDLERGRSLAAANPLRDTGIAAQMTLEECIADAESAA